MWWLLLLPVLVYLVFLAALYAGQTSMLFPVGQVGPAPPLPAGAQRLSFTPAGGEQLAGIHIAPSTPGRERLLVLGFGGNAWNAEAMADLLHRLYPEADIVAFHYRGYRPSGGRPGAAAFRSDAAAIFDWVRPRLRPARTVAIGFSIGSGVAAALAAERPVDGLILVTPFDSLGKVAAGHYRWLPVRLLLRDRLEPAEDLRGTDVPVATLAGASDRLIPAQRTDALRRAVSRLVFDRTIDGAGHNDIYDRPEFRAAMSEALATLQGH